MPHFNPYQAPNADLTERHEQDNGIRRHGKNVLFIPKGVDLPHRCIKCNAPTTTDKRMTYYYSYPFLGLGLLAGFLVLGFLGLGFLAPFLLIIFGFMAVILQKKQKIYIRLCEHHRKVRIWQKVLGLFGFFGGLGVIMVLVNLQIEYIPLNFLLTFFIIFCLWIIAKADKLGKATKIDKDGAYIKGFSENFLDSFKPF